jgi:FemAB family protein
MEFVLSGSESFTTLWSEFVEGNDNSTYAYLQGELDFVRYYTDKCRVKDLSFVILERDNPICICPLFLEQHGKINTFSVANTHLRAPLFSKKLPGKLLNRTQNECFDKIDQLAQVYNVDKVSFMIDPLSEEHKYNFLFKYGYLDNSVNTCIIDLKQSLDVLWRKLRKSYKSLINNGQKLFEIIIMTNNNLDYDLFCEHKKLHFKAAGRVTRPDETWEAQFEMIKNNNAVLIGIKTNEAYLAFGYFVYHNGKAYYGHASENPDIDSEIPFMHVIMWNAIKFFSENDYQALELGHQYFGKQIFEFPSAKDLQISFFKRGFGGEISTLYRGSKYYNNSVLKNDMLNNINKLIS